MYEKQLNQILDVFPTNDDYEIFYNRDETTFNSLRDAINMGIDSHLEAINFTHNQDERKILIHGSKSLQVLVRRLLELFDTDNDNLSGEEIEEYFSLAANILSTLDIEIL